MKRDRDEAFEDRLVGMLLGLALGDAWERARGSLPTTGPIKIGPGTQLAAFTTDGLIRVCRASRALVPGDAAAELWNATVRWGGRQGLPTSTGHFLLDGWINEVSVLGERRGSSPATVSALASGQPGSLDRPVNRSQGSQAVLRTLPTAAVRGLLPYDGSYGQVDSEFASYAALTHGGESAIDASVITASVAASCLEGRSVHEAVTISPFCVMGSYIGAARDVAEPGLPQAAAISHWLHDDATSAMLAGAYAAMCFPNNGEVTSSLSFLSTMPRCRGAAAVAGALHGASHGIDGFPVNIVSRIELSWVLTILARDLARTLRGGHVAAARYPYRRDLK